MPDPLVYSFASAMFLGGLLGLAWLAARLIRRQPLIPAVPRRPAPWSIREIAIIVGIYILLQVGLASMLGAIRQPAATRTVDVRLLLGAAVANALATLAAGLVLWRRAGANLADLGLDPRVDGLRAIATGIGGFFVVLLPVYGMQWLLSLLFPDAGVHPIAKLLTDNADPLLLLACVLTAVVVAPITEEFFVRGVLQGWLEGRWLRRAKAAERPAQPAQQTPAEPAAGVEASPSRATEPAELHPFASPRATSGPPPPPPDAGPPLMLAPILISSLVFALMHVGHGTAPLPLFFFALALGYVYQRTHHLLPCIVLHASLNACSLLVLWLSVA